MLILLNNAAEQTISACGTFPSFLVTNDINHSRYCDLICASTNIHNKD